jgi:hypothetical protein
MLSVCHLLESVKWNGHYLSQVDCLWSVGGVEGENICSFSFGERITDRLTVRRAESALHASRDTND